MDGTSPAQGEFVQSLARGLAVIRAFDAEHADLSLSEVARISGLTRAAARRFLHTLVELGYVGSDGRLFSLRPRILELGYAYVSSMGLPEVALPHMEALSGRLRESCSLSVLDDGDVVYVARVATRRIMTVAIAVGTRFPAYATSMGRVLLAARDQEWLAGYLAAAPFPSITERTVVDAVALRRVIDRTRTQGYAIVDQELELGLRSIAVPVIDARGETVAAMNVSLPSGRGAAETARREVLPALRSCAKDISLDLRAATAPPVSDPIRPQNG